MCVADCVSSSLHLLFSATLSCSRAISAMASRKVRVWVVVAVLAVTVICMCNRILAANRVLREHLSQTNVIGALPMSADIKDIRNNWIIEPAIGKANIDYKEGEHFSAIGQSKFVDDLLKGRRNGFFIECGAADGMHLSNSLFFELNRGWTGLLVEANPKLFNHIMTLKRNAFVINTCLSLNNKSGPIEYMPAGLMGGVLDIIKIQKDPRYKKQMAVTKAITVQCFPLFLILQSIGVTHVDYFSLDVEGAELDILRTIPFDKIFIDVFTVEVNCRKAYAKEISKFFEATGLYREIPFPHCQDLVFKRI